MTKRKEEEGKGTFFVVVRDVFSGCRHSSCLSGGVWLIGVRFHQESMRWPKNNIENELMVSMIDSFLQVLGIVGASFSPFPRSACPSSSHWPTRAAFAQIPTPGNSSVNFNVQEKEKKVHKSPKNRKKKSRVLNALGPAWPDHTTSAASCRGYVFDDF